MFKTVDEFPAELMDIIRTMQVRTGMDYTEEQMVLMANFNENIVSFADPGVGKTATTVAGITLLNLYHRVPAEQITAMSFTKQATSELKVRYSDSCKKLGIRNNINFRTLDSMCFQVIQTHFEVLGMDKVNTKTTIEYARVIDYLLETAEESNIPLSPNKVRSVYRAIQTLNSGLIFDREHVESKLAFQKTGLTYEEFTQLRSGLYTLYKALDQVPRGDISLYTLEILTRSPEISAQMKEQNKIMVVDEFQDMSLLKLRLLSLLCQKLVVVGDMKQQIFGFNGASSKIIDQYKEAFKDHYQLFLTQSFRCDHTVVDYSKTLIAHNKMHEENFKGVEREGSVHIHEGRFDVNAFAAKLAEEYKANNYIFPERIMFLYRNNQSCIPIIEALYKHQVPVIANKYTPAHQIPVIKDLCALVELAKDPHILANLAILNTIVPEFRSYESIEENPLYKIMRQENCTFFETNYNFRDGYGGELLMRCLSDAREAFAKGAKTSEIFNHVYKVYNKMYLESRSYYLEQEPEFYISLVADLVKEKGYTQFKNEEMRKVTYLEEWAARNEGIRCYTFHASKGTEADRVVILDANEGIIPNTSRLQEVIDAGADIDAAREIRNERSLVFVAVTRAKRTLEIYYTGQLSSLFTGENMYPGLDAVYENNKDTYHDIEDFEIFFNM